MFKGYFDIAIYRWLEESVSPICVKIGRETIVEQIISSNKRLSWVRRLKIWPHLKIMNLESHTYERSPSHWQACDTSIVRYGSCTNLKRQSPRQWRSVLLWSLRTEIWRLIQRRRWEGSYPTLSDTYLNPEIAWKTPGGHSLDIKVFHDRRERGLKGVAVCSSIHSSSVDTRGSWSRT